MLKLSNISKRFGPTVALDGVSLTLQAGEVHALIGENGAGKSTLMNVLAGHVRPDHGRMEIDGQLYAPASPADARTHRITLIHQELSLCPHLTVAENILMGIEPSSAGWLNQRQLQAQAFSVLESFHHPSIKPGARLGDLPLAACQVVEICRAIASNARIILMDEPTSSLPREDVVRLFESIRRLRQTGVSVIYISHFLEEIREIADTFTTLRDGRSIGTGRISEVTDREIVAQMVGRSVENLFPVKGQTTTGETVLEVRNLAQPPKLKEASFELRRGEILGIAGLIGSGRTEMVRLIFGLDRAASGTFELRGQRAFSATSGTPSERIHQGIGYLSEDRKGEGLALPLSIADNTTLTKFSTCSRFGWLKLATQRDQSKSWINQLSVKANTTSQAVRTLSGGNQQKVAVARLLHQNADVLLLDEPTRGIDIGSKAQIYETIRQCANDNRAVLVVSSYLPELLGLCDRIAVMSRGRLSEARPVSEWTPESIMQAAIELK